MQPDIEPKIRDTVYQALHPDQPFRAVYQKPWQDAPSSTPSTGFDLNQAIAGGIFGTGGSNAPIRRVTRLYKPVTMPLLDTRLTDGETIKDVDNCHLELTATVLHTTQLD